MAIQYVGGVGGSRNGNSNATTTQSLTGLTGGIASAPAEGDLVIVACVVGSQGRNAAQAVSGYSTLGTQLNRADDTYDTSLQVSYKVQTSTPDTSITIPAQGNIADAQAWAVMVFRGVDTTTPFDVASVSATLNNTANFNAAAITPTTAGAWIVIAGGGSAATGAVYTAPTDFATDWLSYSGADTNDAMVGMGYYTGWTSSAYDPAAVTGGSTNTANSWCAWTMALRPIPPPDVDLAPTSDTIGVNDWTDLTATVTLDSVAVSGATVTSASSNTTSAVSVVGTAATHATHSSTWGVTTSTPGGTSPDGATIVRLTEDTSTSHHQAYYATTDVSAPGTKIVFAAAEIKRPVGRDYVMVKWDDGANGGGYVYDFSTDTFGDIQTSLGSIEYGGRDLGGDWHLLWCRLTTTSTSTGMGIGFGPSDGGSSYVGDGSTYCDIGRVWSILPGVTDGSGEITVRVMGRAAGTADITASSGGADSSASAITVSAGGGAPYTLTAEFGTYALVGQAAGVRLARRAVADQGSYSLTGQQASVRATRRIVAAQGSYALTGQSAGLRATRQLAAAQGSYALAGQVAVITKGVQLFADPAAYTLSGQAAALRVARRIQAGASGFGPAPLPSIGLLLGADPASVYSLSGQDAILRKGVRMVAGDGAYALSGQIVVLKLARRVQVDAGAYALDGQDASLLRTGSTMDAAAGVYALAGQDARVLYSRRMLAAVGTYGLTGYAATLRAARTLGLGPGTYLLAGQAAAFRRTRVLQAEQGTYALAGQDAGLSYSGGAPSSPAGRSWPAKRRRLSL